MVGLLVLTLTWALMEILSPGGAQATGVAEAWVLPAAMAASSIVSSLLARRKGGASQTPGDRELMAQEASDRTRGTAAEDSYLSFLDTYDPSKAATATAGAMGKSWLKDFGRGMESLQGREVAGWRLNTGFGEEDESRYVGDFNENVANAMARLSMDAEGMRMGAAERRGNFGMALTGRATDLAAGRRDQSRLDAASKRSMYGSLASSVLAAGGDALSAWLANRGR